MIEGRGTGDVGGSFGVCSHPEKFHSGPGKTEP